MSALLVTFEVACTWPSCDEADQVSMARPKLGVALRILRSRGWAVRGSYRRGWGARCPEHRGRMA